jgi:hypothetical protein
VKWHQGVANIVFDNAYGVDGDVCCGGLGRELGADLASCSSSNRYQGCTRKNHPHQQDRCVNGDVGYGGCYGGSCGCCYNGCEAVSVVHEIHDGGKR